MCSEFWIFIYWNNFRKHNTLVALHIGGQSAAFINVEVIRFTVLERNVSLFILYYFALCGISLRGGEGVSWNSVI